MPFKHNYSRRHRIGKMKFKVTNWPEYEAGLRDRGSLTAWLTPEALAGWPAPRRKTRGGQPRYSDLAIETALKLGLVFGLRLRQAEGLLASVLQMMRLALAVPDHPHSAGGRGRGNCPTDGPIGRDHRTGRCMLLSIAPVLRSMARASGWRRNMAPNPVAVGASCI